MNVFYLVMIAAFVAIILGVIAEQNQKKKRRK